MGVRIVYVVDTTGTFLPEDVRRYVEAIHDASDVTVGYHGHNNLGMAVANTLEAFEAGADFLDGTLMGFGRGAGNCQTECLIAALQRRGHLAGSIWIGFSMRRGQICWDGPRRATASIRGKSPLDCTASIRCSSSTSVRQRKGEPFGAPRYPGNRKKRRGALAVHGRHRSGRRRDVGMNAPNTRAAGQLRLGADAGTTDYPATLDSRLLMITGACVLLPVMAVLDTTVVNVAQRTFINEFCLTQAVVAWTMTGYTLSLAAVIPLTGWAANRLGTKRLVLGSVLLFSMGSLLCALASNITLLVAFRALQGLAAECSYRYSSSSWIALPVRNGWTGCSQSAWFPF